MIEPSTNKYLRSIHSAVSNKSVDVDVYSVLVAFKVENPAVQHAVKKLLCPGQRGAKSLLQDLKEAKASLERAIVIEESISALPDLSFDAGDPLTSNGDRG